MLRAIVRADLAKLRRPIERAADGEPAFRDIIDGWRREVSRQLDAGAAGGVRWPPRKPFGKEPGGPSRLQRTGVLRRAWLGGPGSITKVGPTGGRFGIDGARVPYARIHRGTAGPITPATFRVVTRQPVTERMRRALAARGVFLRRSTRFLVTPARPHGVASPVIVGQAVNIYRQHLVGAS